MLTCGWVYPHVPGPSPTDVHGCTHSQREHPGTPHTHPRAGPLHHGTLGSRTSVVTPDFPGDRPGSTLTSQPTLGCFLVRTVGRRRLQEPVPRITGHGQGTGASAGHPVVTGTSGRENILPNRPAQSQTTPSQAAPVGQQPPALPAHCCWPHSEPRPQAWKRHLCPARGSAWSNISRRPRPHTFLRSPSPDPLPTHTLCPRAGLLGEAPCPQRQH